jgi:AraC-like DNA-binding protein
MKFFTSMIGERIGDGSIHLSIEPQQLAKLYVRIGISAALQQNFAAFFLWEQLKLFEVLAWLIGQPIELKKVELPFAACAEVDQFIGRLRCPVQYGATGYGFYFAKALLEKPVVRTLPELKSFLKIFGAVFVSEEQFNRPPLSQRIERILEKQALDHGSMPSASELANALNMSEATMRRHLQEGGNSFSEIKSACRLRLGKKLLAAPNRDVEDIAQQLGYQDVNAFRRAFRQLSGQTPEGFRKSVLETHAG